MSGRFPLTRPQGSEGMVISLPGVLNRAAEQCKRSRDGKHLEFPLTELLKGIEYLRSSQSDEDALKRLEQFLRLWVHD